MEIVFIHLGKSLPKYLIKNINRTNQLFPAHSITLIVSDPTLCKKKVKGASHIFLYDLSYSPLNQSSGTILKNESRSRFWRYSFERLLAFSAWHETKPHTKALHIESDVILLPEFKFESFESSTKLMWANVNSDHDIAALLFSPNFTESKWVSLKLCEQLAINPEVTDMTALFIVRKSFSTRIDELITVPIPKIQENKLEKKQPLYDGARIGMWLCGEDPRNHFGFLIKHIQHLDSDVKPANYEFHINEAGAITIKNEGSSWQLQNLHIHSKRLELFSNSNNDALLKDIKKSMYKDKKIEFTPVLSTHILLGKIKNQLWKLKEAKSF